MAETTNSTFRTKTGTCSVLPDRIVIRREGASGRLATAIVGNSITRALVVHGIIALSLVGFAVYLVVNSQSFLAVLPLAIALVFLRGIIRSRHFSAIPVIPRDAIETIEVHEPRPGATRGYFLVHFRLDDAPKKRIIMLPGTMSDGGAEFKHALDVLRHHNLITDATASRLT